MTPATAHRRRSAQRATLTVCVLLASSACSLFKCGGGNPPDATPDAGPTTSGGDAGGTNPGGNSDANGMELTDSGVDAGTVSTPPTCFPNPVTYFEIINACTSATPVPINSEPPCLLADGGVPALDASLAPCLLDAGYVFPDAGPPDAGPQRQRDGGFVDAGPPLCTENGETCRGNNDCCADSVCTTYTTICQNHCGTDYSRCATNSDCCPNFKCEQNPPGPAIGPYCAPTVACIPLTDSCSPTGAACCATSPGEISACGPYSLKCLLSVGSTCSSNAQCSSGTCTMGTCQCAAEGASCDQYNDCCPTDSSGNTVTCLNQVCQPGD